MAEARWKILFVDDQRHNLVIIEHIMKREQFELLHASSGVEALELIRNGDFRPDLILLDVVMPEMSGHEVCVKLKEDPQTAEIPIIFLTGKTDTEDIIKGFELGAVDYVAKPFHGTELLARIHTHLELKEKRERLRIEQEAIDILLRNILPDKVIQDLKKNGYSTPQTFNDVTVLFVDVVDFTTKSSTLSPAAVIDELNEIFTYFDNIIIGNGGERIKTIGDAYMAVCGMQNPLPDHADVMFGCAMELLALMKERHEENMNKDPRLAWQVRIGIHSGDVVGGVVGVQKYIYDVFGDTINVAARMESLCPAMCVQISSDTYNLLKFPPDCLERREIEVKGKGVMNSYVFS